MGTDEIPRFHVEHVTMQRTPINRCASGAASCPIHTAIDRCDSRTARHRDTQQHQLHVGEILLQPLGQHIGKKS